MTIDTIKTVIMEREQELHKKIAEENIIPREGAVEIQKLFSPDAAVVITGVRRCGKSLLAFLLGETPFGYVNFDDERLTIKAEELNSVLEAVYALKGEVNFFIFDEIQNIVGWEKFVSRLLPGKKIIITGSNARLMSKELATHLTGRHLDITLYPFSFREFLLLKKLKINTHLTKDIAQIKAALAEYVERGGFPLTYRLGNIFLAETYKDIIERDIIQRYGIRYASTMKELAKYLFSNVGKEITYNSLRKFLNIRSVHTIKNYCSYLQNAYLIFLVERFSFSLKEQALAPKKVYSIDNGLTQAIGFQFSQNRGRFVENAVAIELLRKSGPGTFYYWKDYQQNEVDFVVKNKKQIKELLQVHAISTREEIEEMEIKALIKGSDSLRCRNLKVITWDYTSTRRYDKKTVEFIPLWKWLAT
ncbi:ATP-binding protein [Candidatus Woesearchaeota archaeon]|nr:ATP-binding protein [Candidatus Woesearchaeota archaeon]